MSRKFLFVAVITILASAGIIRPLQAQALNTEPYEDGNRLRYSVSVDGDFAVVGVPWYDGFRGGAWALRREGGVWAVEQVLSPGDPGRFDHFGCSVSVSGNRIVVGASWHDMLRGAAYVFRRKEDGWVQEQKLAPEDRVSEGGFGKDVSLIGKPMPAGRDERNDTSLPDGEVLNALIDSGSLGADAAPPPVPAAPPDPVGTVTATNGTLEDRVEIRWSSAGLDAIVYKVLRDGELLSIAASDESLFVDTSADLNTTYSYCVTVKNMAEEESAPVCADGLRIIFPPVSMSSSDGEYTDRVVISWKDISRIEEGYYVYRDAERIDSTGANGSWVYDTTGTPGSVYDYEVRAFAEGAQSAGVADSGWRGVLLPPLDVSATDGLYPDRVLITWDDQVDTEKGYRIYRNSVLIDSTEVDSTSYMDTTVVYGMTYEYCVATVDSSDTESVRVCDEGGTGLAAPGSVSASDSTYDDRIRVTWDDLESNEDGYEISRALGPDTTVLDTTRTNAESYDDFSAEPDTTYTYFVRAVSNSGGYSPPVSDEGFRSVVLAPFDVEATDGDFEDRVDITWGSSSTTTVLFKIYRDGTFIKSLSVGNSMYSDFGGTAGTIYDYTVVAATALEAAAAGVSDGGSRELAVPTAVEATDEEYEDRIVISWADNSELEHGYAVTRRDTSEAEADTTFTIGPNRTSMTDFEAVPGVTYSYSVTAFDSIGGEPGYSDPAEDLGLRVLLAPTMVQAGDAEYEEKVEIFWKDNSGAEDGYRIYRDDVLVGETADNFTSFVDTSPDLGVTHTYSVAAYDSVYPSAMGESEKDSDTGSTTILAPATFNASDVYEDRVELAWVDVSGVETGFVIMRDDGPSTETDSIGFVGPDVTMFTDYPPEQGVSYRYCVRSVRNTVLSSEEVCDDGSLAVPISASSIQLSSKLRQSDPEVLDRYGISLATGRGVALVGAYWDRNLMLQTGAAFLFERNPDGTWSLAEKLMAASPMHADEFGVSVAVGEGIALVGSRGYSSGTGIVEVFTRGPDGAWERQDPILPPDPDPGDKFGCAVSISGDLAVVGANERGSVTGAAYVYERQTDGSWDFVDTLKADNGAPNDNFGYSVSIDGGTAIVGAYGKEDSRGSAYIFQLDGESWSQVQELVADDGASNDQLGSKVDISGDLAIAGAKGDNNQQGAVYVFHRQIDGSWTTEQKLVASDGAAGDEFGVSAELREGAAVVGAWFDDEGGYSNSGAAFLFERSSDGQWIQKQKMTSGDPGPSYHFGRAVAIGVDAMLFGEYGNSEEAYQGGAAYLLETPSPPEDVSASDGAFDSKVRVVWRDVSSIEDGYHIYRDGEPIQDVPASVEVFEDYDAEPGRTHEYSVASFRSESEASFSLDRISDFGWRPPNGNITGRIATVGGGASEGIYVGLDPLPTKALLFDGAGGHVRVADTGGDLEFTTGDDFTVEAWFRYVGDGGSGDRDGTLIAKVTPRGSGYKRYPFWLSNMRAEEDPGRLSFSMGDGSMNVGVSSISDDLNDNEWHHVACVHDAEEDKLLLYIDGLLENVTPYTGLGDISNPDSLSFGAGATSGSWFGGQLDEIRIWDVARDSTQIGGSMHDRMTGEEVGLVAYWPLDEGSTGVITNPHSADHYGVFSGGVYWTGNCAPLEIHATTGESGTYVLDDLHYGSETTFRVRPFEGNRQFDPPFTLITLSVDQPVQNQVNFSDISSYTLSGVVMYESSECPATDVPVYVDGSIAGATDKNGKFAVAVDNGWHSVRPFLEGHTFEPDSFYVEVLGNMDLPAFADLTVRTLSGTVGGGCGRRIGDVVITVQSENGCMTRAVTADSAYSLSLPPQVYLVSASVVESSIPDGLLKPDVIGFFQNLGMRAAELDSNDVVMDMTYRAPLKVDIEGFQAYVPTGCGALTFEGRTLPEDLPVVPQLEVLYLVIHVNEDYGSEDPCPLDTGTVVIYDEIFDREDRPLEIGVKDGEARYTTFASTPSLIIGRTDSEGNDRSFQKAIHAMAVVEGRSPVTGEAWVLVTGHVAEAGADFITATSHIPLYILRDPPGDHSYAFLEKGSTINNCIYYDDYYLKGQSGIRIKSEWGIDMQFFIGFGAGSIMGNLIQSESEVEALFGRITHWENRTDVSVTTKERVSTSPGEVFNGEESDVYIGAGVNYIFSEVEYVDLEDCEVKRTTGIGFQPDSIETMYAYTEQYIEDIMIPDYQAAIDYLDPIEPERADSFRTWRDNWLQWIDFNEDLKAEAGFVENRSFSAGADFSMTTRADTVKTYWWKQWFISDSKFTVFGLDLGNTAIGIDIKFPVEIHHQENTGYNMHDSTWTKTTGYAFSDDDVGDHFTVNILEDEAYSSKVFDVLAGASSCPYEAWPDTAGEARVMSRDKPVILIEPPQGLYDVPSDEPAVFKLILSNQSPTGEARRYALREIATLNPYGAILRVNGVYINDNLVYVPEGGDTYELTVTVERGPAHYNYDNLGIMVYPLCEWWIFEQTGILNLADTVYFDVTFETPCSDIRLFRPEPGWVVNKDSASVRVILDDYELEIGADINAKELQAVGCEYRRLGTGDAGPADWDTLLVTLPDASTVTDTLMQPPDSLPDGVYELRGFTICQGGCGYSGIVTGTIDRNGPAVFGTPEPSDGDLSFGEDISVTFNEPVGCASIPPDSCVILTWLDGPHAGSTVARETVCDGSTIIIVPAVDPDLLEGRRLEAAVSGIRDAAGNVMKETVTWAFDYRKSRFAWSDGAPGAEVSYRDPGSVTAELVNGTAEDIDFDIIQTPAWIESASPGSGTIESGATALITFDIQETIAIGQYADSVIAEGRTDADTSTAGMFLSLDVSCFAPLWQPDPGEYEHTMTMVAELDIGGEISIDPEDRVSAWVGNELRGVANVQEVAGLGSHLAFITVYGNRTQGETVRFQVWDDDDCRLYNATLESYPFVANGQVGSPAAPVTLTAADVPVTGDGLLAIEVDAGWNWISTNILSPDMSVDGVTADLTPAAGDIVKSQTAFTQFVTDSTGWVPTLVIDNVSSYMIRLSYAGTIFHTGTTVPVDSVIPVGQGWNWIGYLPEGPIELSAALSDLDAGGIVGDDDIIKSRDGFAQFYGGSWYGSLDSMRAGEGYKLYLAGAGDHTFNYPEYSAGPSPPALAAAEDDSRPPVSGAPAENAPAWSVNPRAFQYNMTVTTVLRVDGVEAADPEDIIGAFVGEECRGLARPVYVASMGRHVAFLMIYSDEAQGEEVSFRAFDADAGLVYEIDESIACSADAVEGTVLEPFVLNAGRIREEESDLPAAFGLAQNYPNPFNPATTIQYDVPSGGGNVSIRIYDVGGRLVRVLVDGRETAGRKSVEWEGLDDRGRNVATGVYFYQMKAPGFEKTRKMILLR